MICELAKGRAFSTNESKSAAGLTTPNVKNRTLAT
jgi:hypothetical protein